MPAYTFRLEDMLGESQVEYPEPEPLPENYSGDITPLPSAEAEEILFQKSLDIQEHLATARKVIARVYEEIDDAFHNIGEETHPPNWTPF